MSLGLCYGDSGGAIWIEEKKDGSSVTISTAIGLIKSKRGGACGRSTFGTRITEQKILDWIDDNMVS